MGLSVRMCNELPDVLTEQVYFLLSQLICYRLWIAFYLSVQMDRG